MLCLTKYIPYQGITHAGGEYLEAHLAALREIAEVELLAPPTPLNEASMSRPSVDAYATLLSPIRPKLRGFLFRWFRVEATLAGCSIYWPVRRLFRGAQAPWQQLAAADVIEFQWSEMISLAPLVRKRLPNARLIGVAHDINSQRWQRQADESASRLRRALARFITRRTRTVESRAFASLDTLIVFSEKDARLARELAADVNIEVVHPGLKAKCDFRAPDRTHPVVLFVGAMNRPENWQAALWFVKEIWPNVRASVPTSTFVIAGANPPQRLEEAIARTAGAELTGFVETLAPLYATASVCVVPLRSGAGVKFKTVDAMLSGVPVVTTTVGAEGIEASQLFVAVTDEAATFAAAVVDELANPNNERTRAARQWAEEVYGQATFRAQLQEVYERVRSE